MPTILHHLGYSLSKRMSAVQIQVKINAITYGVRGKWQTVRSFCKKSKRQGKRKEVIALSVQCVLWCIKHKVLFIIMSNSLRLLHFLQKKTFRIAAERF